MPPADTPQETEAPPKRSPWKRWLTRLSVALLLLLVAAGLYCRNYIRTLASLEHIPGTKAYVMDYYADYHPEKIRDQGIDPQNIEDSCIRLLLPDFVLPIASRLKESFLDKRIEVVPNDGHHCSTLFLRSADGTTWLARNQDYFNDAFLVLRIHDEAGVASVAMVDLAYLNLNRDDLETTNLIERIPLLFAPYYACDGMNRHGVAAGVMAVGGVRPPRTPGRPDIFNSMLMRVILDNAKSTEEALDLTRSYNVYFVSEPQHFLVADATGDSRIVEYFDGQVLETPAESDWQICTNNRIFGTDEEDRDSACGRYRTGSELIESLGPDIDDADALAAIRSMSVDGWTMWTASYNLTSGDYEVIYRMETEHPFRDQLPRCRRQ